MPEEIKNVKCADCGLLSRRNPKTSQIVEAESNFRDNLKLPPVAGGDGYDSIPICCARAIEFRKTNQKDDVEENRKLIHEERICVSFITWMPNSSPKEHREMMDRKYELAWQDSQKEKERVWQEKQVANDQIWREKQEKTAADRHKLDMITFIVISLIGITVSGILQIAAAYIARTSPLPPLLP